MGFESPLASPHRESEIERQVHFDDIIVSEAEPKYPYSPDEASDSDGDLEDDDKELLNIQTIAAQEGVPENLTFAGTIPVPYDEAEDGSAGVIREVTEPTSPDPYYSDNLFVRKSSQALSHNENKS